MIQSTEKQFQEIDSVVIRFAGDSGDGMQTVGQQFTDTSAIAGNDINTFPDFPAEIRAPQGTLPGVSSFQIHFGGKKIATAGDAPDVLVAMNPAALKVHLDSLTSQGLLVLNINAFTDDNLKKAGYESNPVDDEFLETQYKVLKVKISDLTLTALADTNLKPAEQLKCKNFFAMGLMYWIYDRSRDYTERWIQEKWKRSPDIVDANLKAFRSGYYYGETAELSIPKYQVRRAVVEPGIYRKISGNEAIVLGLIAASECSWRDIVLGSYPITPASSILEGLAAHKNFNVKTIQAEDEIAAIGIAIGASYAGNLGVTSTSGPGVCLKSEALGLAVMTELPLVVINVQRAGPSTGMPTKTEQADLLQAMFGRNGESPIPILAASSPGDCFYTAIEAVRIAITYRTPVLLLSESYIANSSEPWCVPSVKELPDLVVEPIRPGEKYIPYQRDEKTLARRLAIPGRPGFEHRLGGLEKNEQGQVSYDPLNHERMVKLRAEKVERVADSYPSLTVSGAKTGDILIIGWGGSCGAISIATDELRAEGKSVSSIALRYLNPLPKDLESLIRGFKKVLIPEMNMGQLALLIRGKYLIDAISYSKVQGQPFMIKEIKEKVNELLSN